MLKSYIYKTIRINDWKNYIIPFLLGVIFVTVYIHEIPFIPALRITGLLLASILGTASYGYLLNNLFDVEEDRRAGKSNYAKSLSALSKASMVVIFLFLGLFPWLFLPVCISNFGLFILQLVLLTAYCLPPVRLKRFVCAGVITDALYNSVIMVFVVVFTIREYAVYPLELGTQVLAVLFVVLFLKGLRGILLHQLADRKNDRKAGIITFVTYYGPLFVNNLISKILVPVEFSFLTVFVIILSKFMPGFTWLLLCFVIFTFLKCRIWNFRWIPARNYLFFFRFTLNDFYEQWILMFVLILLSIRDISFLLLLIPFSLMFPTVFFKVYKEIPDGIVSFIIDFKRKFHA